MSPDPFYFDWKFWSALLALVALIKSELPPLHLLLRRAKLQAEPFRRITVFHKVGNPNAGLHLILTNTGGRELKVKAITLDFKRGTDDEFSLSAEGYLQNAADREVVLLTPFTLKAGEEWAHIVQAFKIFSRQEEKQYRQLEGNLREDINSKLSLVQAPAPNAPPVAADDDNVQPLIAFFNSKFRWFPGEYDLTLRVHTDPKSASIAKYYRLTLFESDSKMLLDQVDAYKHGFGVYLNQPNSLLSVPLTEA